MLLVVFIVMGESLKWRPKAGSPQVKFDILLQQTSTLPVKGQILVIT